MSGLQQVLAHLHSKGNIEWTDGREKTKYTVLWHSWSKWANMVHKWAMNSGQVNTVLTVHELVEGDDTRGEEFHGLDSVVMVKILEALADKGKAAMLGTEGVKIFM